jgi:hypothetical protein
MLGIFQRHTYTHEYDFIGFVELAVEIGMEWLQGPLCDVQTIT